MFSLFSVGDFGSILIGDTQEKFYLIQGFLNCAPCPISSAPPGNLLKCKLSGLIKDILNQKLWRWDQKPVLSQALRVIVRNTEV